MADYYLVKQIPTSTIAIRADTFIEHGTPAELYALCGYDADGVERAIREML